MPLVLGVWNSGYVYTFSLDALQPVPFAALPHRLDAPALHHAHQALNPALGVVLRHLPFYKHVEVHSARLQHVRHCMPLNASGMGLPVCSLFYMLVGTLDVCFLCRVFKQHECLGTCRNIHYLLMVCRHGAQWC